MLVVGAALGPLNSPLKIQTCTAVRRGAVPAFGERLFIFLRSHQGESCFTEQDAPDTSPRSSRRRAGGLEFGLVLI